MTRQQDRAKWMGRRAMLLGTAAAIGSAGGSAALIPAALAQSGQGRGKRPNFLMIVVDDMGWSDLSCLGGEIFTPNIARLADQGTLFSNFHVAPTCSPTRSMLITGADNHVAGVGNMKELLADNQRGKPGYEGGLNGRAPTVATLLKNAGYHTYLAGKWHLGYTPAQLPAGQGFEESVVLAEGGADNYEKKTYTPGYASVHFYEGLKEIDLPADFYSTKYWTDRMLGYIDKHAADGKPFFGFLSHQALHQPLQVPAEYTARYLAIYQSGWEAVQKLRYQRQQEMGLMPSGMTLSMPPGVPAWTSLPEEQRRRLAKAMAIYAGMLEYLDVTVGQIVSHLRQKRMLDDTVIMLMSDNGGEGTELVKQFGDWYDKNFDMSYDKMGERGSYVEYGPGWAAAAGAPFSGLKGTTREGGTRSPLIVRWPAKVRVQRTNAFAYVQDLVPTMLELAGVAPSAAVKARLTGRSLAGVLTGGAAPRGPNDATVTELAGNIAVYRGDYKAIRILPPLDDGKWHLYNVARDPVEANDLGATEPALLAQMRGIYDDYVKKNGVVEVPADYNVFVALKKNAEQK